MKFDFSTVPEVTPEVTPERDVFEVSISKLRVIKDDLQTQANKLIEAASDLRLLARRNPGELSNIYLVHANAYLRLANAVIQGTTRLASSDKILQLRVSSEVDRKKQDATLAKERELRKSKKHLESLESRSSNAFSELYGSLVSESEVE